MNPDLKKATKKLAVYSRKSRFTGKGDSIENQIELCKQYIKLHYESITDDDIFVYEDEGFSGSNINRPQFKSMMRDAQEKKFAAIVCYRLDRISRNIGDFAKLIEELNGLGISFISIKEQFDTYSPMGRAMMYIASVFSQLERETTAERIRDNMRELAKTGRWLGGVTPTGYNSEAAEKITMDGKKRKVYHLTIIPEEAKLVQLLYQKFLESRSLTKTESYLIQNNLKTKNSRFFSRFTIKNILVNPVYMIADKTAYHYFFDRGVEIYSDKAEFDGSSGIMAYNKTIQKYGKSNKTRTIAEWIVAVGKHRGMISSLDWIKVQQLLNENKSKSYRRPRSNVALLPGLLFCGRCGSCMRPKLASRKSAKCGSDYSYLCKMKEKSRCQKCNITNPSGNTLDRFVCEEIKKLSFDHSELVEKLKNSEKKISRKGPGFDEEREYLIKTFNNNEAEISNLIASIAKSADSYAQGYLINQINKLHEENLAVKNRIDKLIIKDKRITLSEIQLDIIRNRLVSFEDIFEQMPVEQKRAALRTLIQKITWDGEDIHIYLFGASEKNPEPDEMKNIPQKQTSEPLCEYSK